MFIVMHCMGMPFNGKTVETESLGGSESAAYYVAKELARAGHRVTLFTTHAEEGTWDDVQYVNVGEITQDSPLGGRFHFYAQNTPHDVLIIQRHPEAFRFPWASKINLWWTHDLGLKRHRATIQNMFWNIDGVLTVSEYHKKQLCDVYGINPEVVFPITNGVDFALFEKDLTDTDRFGFGEDSKDQFKMLYSSRPERGLEHLVRPGGIMEQLAGEGPEYHLYVCAYDNVTDQTAPYYREIYERIDAMPNATNLGALTKQQLADVMRQCQLLVYPTPGPAQPEFNEVSCITAMEAMAAGLPFLSTARGALPETCAGSGSILTKPATAGPGCGEGMPRISSFVSEIKRLAGHYFGGPVSRTHYDRLVNEQRAASSKFSWAAVANDISKCIVPHLVSRAQSPASVARHLMKQSDVFALRYYLDETLGSRSLNPVLRATREELRECYAFAFDDDWEEHYRKVYERERERGVQYGPENLDGNTRFEQVSAIVAKLPSDSFVMDYGCAHGHYTINLAKRFPEMSFIGVDITLSNVETARRWAEDEGLENVHFVHGCVQDDGVLSNLALRCAVNFSNFSAIIAAEVVEHVGRPAHLCDSLAEYLSDDGLMILTTPYGPWEAQGYSEHWPWRAHVHHFDRQDLFELFGKHRDFGIVVAPAGRAKDGQIMGSYVTTYRKPSGPSGEVDYGRKVRETVPRTQTVSYCTIVRDGERDLMRSLVAVQDVADEIIVGVDVETTDRTREVVHNFAQDRRGLWPVVRVIDVPSPLEAGFDEARNLTLREASCDWVLWGDADEVLVHPENIYKYLRSNQFGGYAIQQHHFAVEPLGVLKTDMPARLFRNYAGIKFFGVVHEHPETAVNGGIGHAMLIPDLCFAHSGYTTEEVRRARFDRNIGLLVRDREKYPKRKLGKFLWLRDLAQMCKYELERNGGVVTEAMRRRASEGIKLWEELLEANELRMLVDSMEYYGLLARVLGDGFDFSFKLDASKLNGGTHLDRARTVEAHFASRDHVQRLMRAIVDERLKDYESPYY